MRKKRLSGRAGLAAVRFSAEGGQVEKLVNWCMAEGVQLVGLRANELGFTATVPAREYARLRQPARRCRTRLRVVERKGPWFSLRWLLRRPGLLLGPLVFALVLWAGSGFVWSVRFAGIPAAGQRELRRSLFELGLCEGGTATQQSLAAARRQLLKEGRWGWVALNFKDGRLVVEVDPARQEQPVTQTDSRPYYASDNATILANRVENGFACKQPGQTVAAGEMLVSPTRAARDGSLVWQDPLGRVIGLVRKEYSVSQPLEETLTMPTGRTASLWRLSTPFGLWELPLGDCPYESYTQSLFREPLTLFGLALPATLEETLCAETAALPRTLSPGAARALARYRCLAALYEEYPDAEVLAEEVREESGNGEVHYTLCLTFRANIARKPEEGGG